MDALRLTNVYGLAVMHLVPKVGVLRRAAAGENATDLVREEAVA